jgi:predicted transcriptional regulator
MKQDKSSDLSRRERQIMDSIYRLGRASAAEIRAAMDNPPTYTAVRTLLGILHQKGHVRFDSDGTRYVYEPVIPKTEMGRTAIDSVLSTFFDDSIERVVATLLDREESQVTQEQLERLAAMIEQARSEGR